MIQPSTVARPLKVISQPSPYNVSTPGGQYTNQAKADHSNTTAKIMTETKLIDATVKSAGSTSQLAVNKETVGKSQTGVNELLARPWRAVMEVNSSTTANDIFEWLIEASEDGSKLEFALGDSDGGGSKFELWTEVLDLIEKTVTTVPQHVFHIDAGSLIITVPTFAHFTVSVCFCKVLSPALSRIPDYVVTGTGFHYDYRKSNEELKNLALTDGGALSEFENISHYPVEVGYSENIADLRHKMMVQRHLVPGTKLFFIFPLFDDRFMLVNRRLKGAFNLQAEIWEPTVTSEQEGESTCGFGPMPQKKNDVYEEYCKCLVAKVDPAIFETDGAFQRILRAASNPDTNQLKADIAAIAADVANLDPNDADVANRGPNEADDGDPVPDNWVEIDTEKGEIYHIFQPAGIRSADRCFDLVRRRAYIARYPEALEGPVQMTIIGSNGEIQDPAAERALEFDLAPYHDEDAGVLLFDEFFQNILKRRFGRQYTGQMIQYVEDPEARTRAFGLDGHAWALFRDERLARRQERRFKSDPEQENAAREIERQEIAFAPQEEERLRQLGAFELPPVQQRLDRIYSEEREESESRYRDLPVENNGLHMQQRLDRIYGEAREESESRYRDVPVVNYGWHSSSSPEREDSNDPDYEDDGSDMSVSSD